MKPSEIGSGTGRETGHLEVSETRQRPPLKGKGLVNRTPGFTQAPHSALRLRAFVNKTGFTGVKQRARDGRFEAYIRDMRQSGKPKVYCGSRATAEEAARVYDAAARAMYGDGVDERLLNFPATAA